MAMAEITAAIKTTMVNSIMVKPADRTYLRRFTTESAEPRSWREELLEFEISVIVIVVSSNSKAMPLSLESREDPGRRKMTRWYYGS